MKTSSGNSVASSKRLSGRGLSRLRNAVARRKLQDLHDEKVLQSWLAEVWDQSTLVGWRQEIGTCQLALLNINTFPCPLRISVSRGRISHWQAVLNAQWR